MSGVPYHAWTHLPKAQGGTDPLLEVEGGAGDTGEYAYRDSANVTICAQDTWTRVALVNNGASGPPGDPFTMVTDGIEMMLGRYVVTGSVYWDGYAETGMVALGTDSGPDVYMRTGISPTIYAVSCSWNFVPQAGFYLEAVYLWAYQTTSAAAQAAGHLVVNELI